MTRQERSELSYIKRSIKELAPGAGCTLTIRTNAGGAFKQTLHELYTSLGFHPASVRTDTRWYDENERIIYIHGLSFELNGEQHPWTELYTAGEKALFEAKLA